MVTFPLHSAGDVAQLMTYYSVLLPLKCDCYAQPSLEALALYSVDEHATIYGAALPLLEGTLHRLV